MKGSEQARARASGAPSRRLLGWAALAVALAGGPFEDARAGCREVAEPLQQALAARDLDGARRHYDAVQGEFACPDALRDQAKRAVSNLHAQVAQERMADGASLASQRALLERGRAYAGTWLTLALLGDVAHDERDYHRAAVRYQEALVAINNEGETPQPPPVAETERIFRLAEQSRMLAGRHVETPKNRSGDPDGLAAPSIRGFVPKKAAYPITFETGKAEFDQDGRLSAEDMAEVLIREAPERIILSAHTDERGADAYNLELSERRGEAVRRFLHARGVTRPIEVRAMGESDPAKLVFPESHYTEKEVWQLNRRVEWIRRMDDGTP